MARGKLLESIVVAFASVVFSAVVSTAACPQCVGPRNHLGDSYVYSSRVSSDPDGTTFYVDRNLAGMPVPCARVVINRTLDQGITWLTPAFIESDPVYTTCVPGSVPVVAASDGAGNVYVSWLALDGSGTRSIVTKTSRDRGTSWPAAVVPVAVPRAAPQELTSMEIVAGPAGQVWLFWVDGVNDSDLGIRVSRSTDYGSSWSAPRSVASEPVDLAAGSIKATRGDSGLLHVLFISNGAMAGRLLYTRSDDGGLSWSAPLAVDGLSSPGSAPGGYKLLALPGGGLLVGWGDDRSGLYEVYTRHSANGGLSWPQPPQRVATGVAPGTSFSGGIELGLLGGSGRVLAVWQDRRLGFRAAFGNLSEDGGATWRAVDFLLSGTAVDQDVSYLRLAAAGDDSVSVAWKDRREATSLCPTLGLCASVWGNRSCDGGETWEPTPEVLQSTDLRAEEVTTMAYWAYSVSGAGLLWKVVSDGNVYTRRVDGPSAIEAQGPLAYCVGNDPVLVARPVSAACSGGFAFQWLVDGVPVPGATSDSYAPSLRAGDHAVAVAVTCASSPPCSLDSLPFALHPRDPSVPTSVGNQLRAVRGAGAAVSLTWPSPGAVPDLHSHVRRSVDKAMPRPWVLVSPDPMLRVGRADDAPPPGQTLWLYDVRHAEPCETESSD